MEEPRPVHLPTRYAQLSQLPLPRLPNQIEVSRLLPVMLCSGALQRETVFAR